MARIESHQGEKQQYEEKIQQLQLQLNASKQREDDLIEMNKESDSEINALQDSIFDLKSHAETLNEDHESFKSHQLRLLRSWNFQLRDNKSELHKLSADIKKKYA